MDPTNQPTSSYSAPSLGTSSDGDSPYDCENINFSYAVYKYIDDMLMEEDVDGKTCMLQECLALQATEKSFYDVLGQKYPPSPNDHSPCINQNGGSPDDNFVCSRSIGSNESYTATNNLVDSSWIRHQPESESRLLQTSDVDCPESPLLLPNLQSEMQPFGQWRVGRYGDRVTSAPLCNSLKSFLIEKEVVTEAEKEKRNYSSDGLRERKNYRHESGDCLEAERSSKHSVILLEESEESDLFDEVIIPKGGNYDSVPCPLFEAARNRDGFKFPHNEKIKGSNSRIMRMMKQGNSSKLADLWSLLTQCAQAVATYDRRTTNELLKQIRQYSSPYGDGTQRLAHYFANGLEARLAGTATPYFCPSFFSRTSVADLLKAYMAYISASPFRKASNFLTNRTIGKAAEKVTRLHIIDFGISYGLQWPCFIQRQSFRPGGPPKIRLTGIELPQPGFRPAERVEATGRRLKKVSERCNVPFEYNVIAQKWETITDEDLKIDRDEVTIVTCMYRLNNLPDDTVLDNSPRDAVLKLIKSINPDLFVHGVANGTYNSPFFVSRFREALFHFSALFDMFEATVSSEDQGRMIFEREVIGRQAMNVVACEGLERTDSPETYKQWQARNLRAGFRQLPLDQELFKKVRNMVKMEYHRDFVIDQSGHWMLQGWKGKVIYALSFWKPVIVEN